MSDSVILLLLVLLCY